MHVVGAGTMGAAIAHCIAIAGMRTVLIDVLESALDRARGRIARDERLLRLSRRRAMADAISPGDRIGTTTDAGALKDARFVIECVPEKIGLKEALYSQIDALCAGDAILATATSAIPIERIATWTRRPNRVIGLHFMNPAQWKDSVEVIRGQATSDSTWDLAMRFLQLLGKRVIEAPDGPGFVINRVLMPAINDAARLTRAGNCAASTVDRLFKDCVGHRSGPLETADLIGLDTVVDTLDVLHEYEGDEQFRPCEVLVEMVAGGRLGRKSGRGFYEYQEL